MKSLAIPETNVLLDCAQRRFSTEFFQSSTLKCRPKVPIAMKWLQKQKDTKSMCFGAPKFFFLTFSHFFFLWFDMAARRVSLAPFCFQVRYFITFPQISSNFLKLHSEFIWIPLRIQPKNTKKDAFSSLPGAAAPTSASPREIAVAQAADLPPPRKKQTDGDAKPGKLPLRKACPEASFGDSCHMSDI